MDTGFRICKEHIEPVVYDDGQQHCCPSHLIGECLSLRCSNQTRDLDRYFNCSVCGSMLIQNLRAKWTRAEIVKSWRELELASSDSEFWSSTFPIVSIALHMWSMAVRYARRSLSFQQITSEERGKVMDE